MLIYLRSSDHQSALSAKLDGLKKDQDALAINYDAKLDQIRDEILALVGQKSVSEGATQMAQLASLKTKLDALGKEHMACINQAAIIKSLYFPVLRRRWSQIPKADKATNMWIFDPSLTSFTAWLGSTDEDDGLYCITGRVNKALFTMPQCICTNTNDRRRAAANQL
jgi:hypothetical protein